MIYRLRKKFHFFVELNIVIGNNDFSAYLEKYKLDMSVITNTHRELYIGTNLQSFQIYVDVIFLSSFLSFGNFVPKNLTTD